MNKLITSILITLTLFGCASYKEKIQYDKRLPFIGPDFTGIYSCIGHDSIDGEYKAKETLILKKEHSQAQYASYDFLLEAQNFGRYPGHMVTNGLNAAIYFALEDQSQHDFGSGVAQFSKNVNGQWQYHKFYYEPQYKGGDTGFEDCIQQ